MRQRSKHSRIAAPEQIRRAREKLNQTREGLAAKASLSADAIKKIEDGDTLFPHKNTCLNIAQALGENIDALFPMAKDLIESASSRNPVKPANKISFSLFNYHITRDSAVSSSPIWVECTLEFHETDSCVYVIREENDDLSYGHEIVGREHDGKLYLFGNGPESNTDDFSAYYWKQSGRWVGYWFGRDWNHQEIISLAMLSKGRLSDEELSRVAVQMKTPIERIHDWIIVPEAEKMKICRIKNGTPRKIEC